MFNYAGKHRFLPPYYENPFSQIDTERIPIEDAKPVEPFTPKQEADFLAACDAWQFPIFLTMTLTGMRPGELVHLLTPDDVDLQQKVIRVRNKPDLGWKTKARNERDIPICEELSRVMLHVMARRKSGPVFLRRRFFAIRKLPPLVGLDRQRLAAELRKRIELARATRSEEWTRFDDARSARNLWRDAGAIKEAILRVEFMSVTAKIGLAHVTCPKMLRHVFATCLQDANIDPLIRQELMGHMPGQRNGNGLGMTTVYTHTRDATRRSQFEVAMATRKAAIGAARRWLLRG